MTNARSGPRLSQCSFCGKTQTRSSLVVAGKGQATVCYECIRVLGQLIETEQPVQPVRAKKDGPLVPRSIYANLDEYVVGQEKAKKVLSVAVYNHFKRIWNGANKSDVELQKANILLVGPTGCGKTMLAETLARTLAVPFAVCDATSLTESGYVGEDVENILLRLIQAADWDIGKAEQGIIYIDELDKIARKEGVNRSITRDVSGEGVQQELLKIIEGCVANVPPHGGRKHPHQEFLQINTKNILFICGGAFEGLEDIVSRRITYSGSQMGFLSGSRYKTETDDNILSYVTPEDLLTYGFIPELVGRLPVVTSLEHLDRDALMRVLVEPKNAIVKQYQQLFSIDNVQLEFTQEALEAAADKALTHQTGARCLRYIVEETLMEVMYELPSLEGVVRCVVDRDAIEGINSPELITASGESFRLPFGPIQKSA
ncbi:MAG: ATP-dependent Clp protease ATP-binding subunit ClpX [Chloroflexi bacterium]|nr:ATP-dependent Clp protease ATP-binding subunit ClpX [Chloroflexota bacterium]MDA1218703.1 ATP-dependent Clp protease ATP-binding subunit ClpX [Chloroflexota bacterium]PKB57789.1 MAG: ATP-dependent protease ATP-binding subunit ClpX [SAR202 cluster bacterium Casp-Chloro-G3]